MNADLPPLEPASDTQVPGITVNIRVEGSATANTVVFGDQFVYQYLNEPPYQVEPFPSQPPEAPFDARRVPSRLLSAHHEVVGYLPRPEAADLDRWCEELGAQVRVCVLHAEGGAGKTRLARHFAARATAAGWTVALVRHRSELASAGGGDQSLAVRPPGLVLIVDYADRWPPGDLVALIRQHRDAGPGRIRVLLLARRAERWWQSLAHQFVKLGVDAEALALAGLPPETDARAVAYRAARDRFVGVYGLTLEDSPLADTPEDLTDESYSLMLTVHMRALVDVDAAARGVTPSRSASGPAGLSSYLLDREYDNWRSLFNEGHGPSLTDERRIGRAVYVGALTGEVDRATGIGALLRTGVVRNEKAAETVLDDYARCYSPQQDGAVLAPLLPDRLAEDYLALTLPGAGSAHGYDASDEWAQHAVMRLLVDAEPIAVSGVAGSAVTGPAVTGSAVTGPTVAASSVAVPANVPYLGRALAVLVESARRWPVVTRAHLDPVLSRVPVLGRSATSVVLTRMADLEALPEPTLDAVEAALPQTRHVDLDLGAAALTRRVFAHRLHRADRTDERARVHHHLAARENNAGDDVRSLAAVSEAVRLLREAAAQDAEHRPALADALTDLSSVLEHNARADEARAAAEEALALTVELAAADPQAHARRLGTAFDTLASSLSDLDLWPEALAPAQEALRIRRQAASDPGDLAASLANSALRDLEAHPSPDPGDYDAAVRKATEAVAIFRTLAEREPQVHLPDLASALGTLSTLSGLAEKPAQALAATREAVQIRRTLAGVNPQAYRLALADSLVNLCHDLARSGLTDEALAAAVEAVDLWRAQHRSAEDIDLTRFASALSNLGTTLLRAGRPAEALAPLREALSVMRSVSDRHPSKLPETASQLIPLAACLDALGHPWWALAASRQAAAILTAFDEHDRHAGGTDNRFLPVTEVALTDLMNRLERLGRSDEALPIRMTRLGVMSRMAELHPRLDTGVAAQADQLGQQLVALGRYEEAETMLRAGLAASRRLAAVDVKYLPGLSTALGHLIEALTAAGDAEELPSLLRERAEATFQVLRGSDDVLTTTLGHDTIADLAVAFAALGCHGDALALCRVLYERHLQDEDFTLSVIHFPRLIEALNTCSADLPRPDAVEVLRQAAALSMVLVAVLPDLGTEELAETIRRLGALVAHSTDPLDAPALGDLRAAVAAYSEATGGTAVSVIAEGEGTAHSVVIGDLEVHAMDDPEVES